MKKIYIAILFTIIALLPTQSLALNKITACDPCGSAGREFAAKSLFNWNQGGNIFVVDFYNRTGYKYNVYIDYIKEGQDNFPIHKTLELPLTSLEIVALSELFYLYDELKSAVQNNSSSSNTSLANSIFSSASNSSPFNLGTIAVTDPQYTAHDFISNSQLRNNLYITHIGDGLPENLITSVNKITDHLELGILNLTNLKFGYTIKFEDGSSVLVVPDLTNETLIVHEGSAKDADNNTIPTNRYSIAGSYAFSSYNHYNSMRQYLETIFGVKGLNDMRCTSYVMWCTFSGNTLTCTVPRCNY